MTRVFLRPCITVNAMRICRSKASSAHTAAHTIPESRVCVRCHSKDLWSPACYSDLTGKVVTYTLDAFFPSPEHQPLSALLKW